MTKLELIALVTLAGCASSQAVGEADRANTAKTAKATRTAPAGWTQPPASAGFVGAAGFDRSPAEIAALRQQGPAALAPLLARYDAMAPGPQRTRLGNTIDKVAGQRYATVSRMFWYTDLERAKAAARASGKQILSLRMLGRLDEDLSCANSRLFRIVLYANQALSAFLRDKFVLHWSSERPVPRVVIDYGDGRVMQRTITGNSVHYVLDADGRPIDALPGVYAPAVFRAELKASLGMAALAELSGDARNLALAELHRQRLAARLDEWKKLGAIQVPLRSFNRLITPAETAQFATMTKSAMEMQTLRVVSLGLEVGKIEDDPETWAQLGLRLLPGAMARPGNARNAILAADLRKPAWRTRMLPAAGGGQPAHRVPVAPSPVRIPEVLDEASRRLIASLQPLDWQTRAPANVRRIDAVIKRLERDVVADTAKNEFSVRLPIRGFFVNRQAGELARLNASVYASVFQTPATDAWLGLAPTTFLALPKDGLVSAQP